LLYRDPAANLLGWRIVEQWCLTLHRATLPWVAEALERRDAASLSWLECDP
jgi:hypothetical protein